MQVRIDLCAACAQTLRGIVEKRGELAMQRAVSRVLQSCGACRLQLPAELREKPFTTEAKPRNEKD